MAAEARQLCQEQNTITFKGRVENFKIDPVDIEKDKLRNNKKKLEPRGRKRVLVA